MLIFYIKTSALSALLVSALSIVSSLVSEMYLGGAPWRIQSSVMMTDVIPDPGTSNIVSSNIDSMMDLNPLAKLAMNRKTVDQHCPF